ncbi:hypothetical protein [Desmospora profundinema]|uniref:Uncharacterized protein n=1 Tax=Desmospora profundinema TaxID=1571184 RepID=A0ABU1IIP7_9BACL|nr:hypothetical protein [Desmospora profundinema]MDR6224640.1 hypothetical protein [Desmospora profundinema]
MLRNDGDLLVLVLLAILIVYSLARAWSRAEWNSTIQWSTAPIRGEVPEWLEEEGYDVVAAKQRLPLLVRMGEKEMESRLYVDYVARKNNRTYLVFQAKAKQPLRISGSALRDRFLVYVLAFQAAGVVYVDPYSRSCHTITFFVAGVPLPKGKRRVVSHLVTLVLGILIAIWIQ